MAIKNYIESNLIAAFLSHINENNKQQISEMK